MLEPLIRLVKFNGVKLRIGQFQIVPFGLMVDETVHRDPNHIFNKSKRGLVTVLLELSRKNKLGDVAA